MVDEEDELLRLSDDDENGSQVETNANIDDVTAFIDSYCNDEADTTVVPAAVKKDEGKKTLFLSRNCHEFDVRKF